MIHSPIDISKTFKLIKSDISILIWGLYIVNKKMLNTLTAHISPSHSSVHLQTKKPLSGVLSHVGSQWPLFLQRIESLKQNYEQWKMMEHLNAWNGQIMYLILPSKG